MRLLRQRCTSVTMAVDNQSVADYFDELVDLGRTPEQFARIWIHTHASGRLTSSECHGEATVDRCFAEAKWAVMLVVAHGGQTFARLRVKAGPGPGGELILPVKIDFHESFLGSDRLAW